MDKPPAKDVPPIESFVWTYTEPNNKYHKAYGWKNPDEDSPVAAIIVDTEDLAPVFPQRGGLALAIELVPRWEKKRDRFTPKTYNRIEWGFGWSPGNAVIVPSDEVIKLHADRHNLYEGGKQGFWEKELPDMGLPHSRDTVSVCLMDHVARDAEGLQWMGERGRQIMTYLNHEKILSQDPAIRAAIVESMGKVLTQAMQETAPLQPWTKRIADKSDPSLDEGRS